MFVEHEYRIDVWCKGGIGWDGGILLKVLDILRVKVVVGGIACQVACRITCRVAMAVLWFWGCLRRGQLLCLGRLLGRRFWLVLLLALQVLLLLEANVLYTLVRVDQCNPFLGFDSRVLLFRCWVGKDRLVFGLDIVVGLEVGTLVETNCSSPNDLACS